jgi:hypothetical protein
MNKHPRLKLFENRKFERVFGIGCGKTGTTSLTEALNMFGYNTVHYPNKKALEEVFTGNTWNAATDTPIALNFRQLYYMFPNAGFILTTRPVPSWLKSIETHMSIGHGARGHFDPWTRIIRQSLYGEIFFDAEIYEKSYREHTRAVKKFFEENNAMDQLLTLDLIECAKEGLAWQFLEEFLELDGPTCRDFPHANKGLYDGTVERTLKKLNAARLRYLTTSH